MLDPTLLVGVSGLIGAVGAAFMLVTKDMRAMLKVYRDETKIRIEREAKLDSQIQQLEDTVHTLGVQAERTFEVMTDQRRQIEAITEDLARCEERNLGDRRRYTQHVEEDRRSGR